MFCHGLVVGVKVMVMTDSVKAKPLAPDDSSGENFAICYCKRREGCGVFAELGDSGRHWGNEHSAVYCLLIC